MDRILDINKLFLAGGHAHAAIKRSACARPVVTVTANGNTATQLGRSTYATHFRTLAPGPPIKFLIAPTTKK